MDVHMGFTCGHAWNDTKNIGEYCGRSFVLHNSSV